MTLPMSTFSLRGGPDGDATAKLHSLAQRSAILLNLNEQVMKDLRQCCQNNKVVQLLGGMSPKIRYGSKTLDLNVRPETFRHEIYSAASDSPGQLDFTALVAHDAHVKTSEHKQAPEATGEDTALTALKQSLASMAKEKEARKATISNSVITNTKNGTMQSYRQSNSLLNRPSSASSMNSTPRHGAPPTSAPHLDQQATAQEKGMRTALIHLLAIGPASDEKVYSRTHIPRTRLSYTLPKVADKSGANWELNNKSFKELDPWNFKYPLKSQRQSAIDNAIRAFDRIRIPKDDKLWQMLLPKVERGKGKVLSRLHLGVERRDQLGTPGLAPTPIHSTIEKAESNAATPRTGPVSTPRNGAVATGRSATGISIEKRLKEAKKKQEQERKKKEKEAVASDRDPKPKDVSKPRPMPTKRAPVKKVSEKIKSAEIVHDSDDEEGEITEVKPPKKSEGFNGDAQRMSSKVRTTTEKRVMDVKRPAQSEPKVGGVKSQSSGVPPGSVTRPKANDTTSTEKKLGASASTTVSAKPKSTQVPKQASGKLSHGPVSSIERQPSPKKDTRPKVPSPLGTSKPRNASEEAEKPRNGLPPKVLKSATPSSAPSKTAGSTSVTKAAKPSMSGDTSGRLGPVVKKRPLEQVTDAVSPPHKISKVNGSTIKGSRLESAKANTTTAVSARPAQDGNTKRVAPPKNTDGNLKRKANDLSSNVHDHDIPASKHRKTDSSSTHSLDQTNSSLTSLTTAPTVSPDPTSSRSPLQRTDPTGMDVIQMFLNDSEASPKTQSTWETALDKAVKFRTQLYPAYLELYDKLESMAPEEVVEEDRRTLFMMHSKLKAFKKDIYDAVG